MIVAIHQPQFLPWLGYFDKMRRADVFIILDNAQFKKNEWQNRNRIKMHAGWQWLTVPVIHHFGQLIRDVKINNHVNWKRKHINALQFHYKKTPFFDQYFQQLKTIYDQDWEYLLDFNLALLNQIDSWLNYNTQFKMSSDLDVNEEGTVRLVNLCKSLGAETYLSGAGAKDYLDFELFQKNQIEVIVQNYGHPAYTQFSENHNGTNFVSNLSIIDLLFNCGQNSSAVLSGEKDT
jgi:hypothetical protein